MSQSVLIVNNTNADLDFCRTQILESAKTGCLAGDLNDLFRVRVLLETREVHSRTYTTVVIVDWA